MKTNRSVHRTRAIREKPERTNPACEKAVRLCEETAAKIKAAGEELAACWLTLGRELASGASAIQLLRKRAWCNVLELRLREQTRALEGARHGVDAVWDDMMGSVRHRELLGRLLRKGSDELSKANQVWPLLTQPPPRAPGRANIQFKK